jgi:activating signal cointegrator complex subunit 3
LQKKDAIKKKKGKNKNDNALTLTFFVPYKIEEGKNRARASEFYNIWIISDRWVANQTRACVYLEDISVPDEDYPHTKLLDLRPLPLSALQNAKFE